MKFIISILTLLALLSTHVKAEENESSFRFSPLLGTMLSAGGDELGSVTTYYEDGDTSTADVTAGGLFGFYGGVYVEAANHPFAAQATIGYHFDYQGADNGSLNWNRIPLEVLGFYKVNSFKFGAGFNYSMSASFSGAGESRDFENSLGLVLQFAYLLNSGNSSVGVKYTDIEYDYKLSQEERASVEFARVYFDEQVSFKPLDGSYIGVFYDHYF